MRREVLRRFIINMAILTFVMFTVWALVRSFMNRPPGDYETEVCDMRLKDKLYDQALQAANTALEKTKTYLQVLYDDVIDGLKKDIPAEKVIETAAQSEKDKWVLFDRVNPGNVVRTFMRYEWEY